MFLAAKDCSNIEYIRLGFEKTTHMAITHTYLSLNMPLPTLATEHPKHKSSNTNDPGFPLMHTPIQLMVMRKNL